MISAFTAEHFKLSIKSNKGRQRQQGTEVSQHPKKAHRRQLYWDTRKLGGGENQKTQTKRLLGSTKKSARDKGKKSKDKDKANKKSCEITLIKVMNECLFKACD